jgi:hypothetical protein
MKCIRVFFTICLIVIISMLVGLTTRSAQSHQPFAQPITLNAGMTSTEVVAALPRNQTLYFNGQQWDSIKCWNPYSSNCNNAMAIVQQDNPRVTVFETPYIYNMLNGDEFPLLAMVLTPGMIPALKSLSRLKPPPIGGMAPR